MIASSRRAPRRLAIAVLIASMTASAAAGAQTPSERALAESLFRDGKQLMARGDYAAACRKLEESYRLDAAGGTLLNLATCHEKEGKVATAWAEYQSALELAKRANRRDRIVLAQKKVDELAGQVPRIIIQVVGDSPPSFAVELDGVALGPGSMGGGLAVDPGEHRVTARADDHDPFESTITARAGETITVAIPQLVRHAEPAPPPGPADVDADGRWMRPTSYALGGVAIVGLVVGTAAGIVALGDASDSAAGCTNGVCDAAGFAAHEDGREAATVSNVGLIIGLLAGAGAVTLFILSPSEDEGPPSPGEAPAACSRRRELASITPIASQTALGGVVRVALP